MHIQVVLKEKNKCIQYIHQKNIFKLSRIILHVHVKFSSLDKIYHQMITSLEFDSLMGLVIYCIIKLYFCSITGTASLNVFSMTCYNVDINVDWGCTAREFPLPGDNLHFDNILRSKFSNTVVLTRFVGSVCYCRRTDCTDVINGSSKITPPVLWSVLLGLILVLIRRFQY